MKEFKVIDIRKNGVFPNLKYRFSNIKEGTENVILERDYLGENPLHYYMDIPNKELIIGNNILDIKEYLEKNKRIFIWERVRAVSNNTRLTINNENFYSTSGKEEEIEIPLGSYDVGEKIDYDDLSIVGKKIRKLLSESIKQRLITIKDLEIGLLLSGGLDSMSVGYLLSKNTSKKIVAFTLKVKENSKDVTKSREIAKHIGIDLVEVKITKLRNNIDLTIQRYDPSRKLIYKKNIGQSMNLKEVVLDSLKIGGNPKKDNIFCSIAMYLIAKAIKSEGVKIVFSGEGPNEMLNDYGFNPKENGFPNEDKGDIKFREALTFGIKKTDRQLGRGGLGKHALVRMGKIFASQGIRLESPYFNKDIARIMTKIPHSKPYDIIKQHLVSKMFEGEGLDKFILGTAKEKFQDGSGVTELLGNYDQHKLLDLFEKIYGIQKTSYLK